MTDLHDISYVRIGSDDLDESVRFATQVLGLELVGRERGAAYLRGDNRDHNIVYLADRSAGHALGFEVKSSERLDQVAAQFEEAGTHVHVGTSAEKEARRVSDFIAVRDPTGNLVELVTHPTASGRRYFPSRDAGITSFSHVGLRSADAKKDEDFWTRFLGARVSDRIGDAALLRIDEVHHKIALFPSQFAGVQHVNFQVESHDDIMRSWYHLQQQNVRIVFGPGRHPTSDARFLYFQGPDGMIYEYSTGVRLISAEEEKTYQPRQFPLSPLSYCMWGSQPDIPEFVPKTKPELAFVA